MSVLTQSLGAPPRPALGATVPVTPHSASPSASHSASTILVNLASTTRTRAHRITINGRDYYVAPATIIVPGVLTGSKGSLYYPPQECVRSAPYWNRIPLTLYHPTDPISNAHLSAYDQGVLDRQGIGYVADPHTLPSGKLRVNAYFDIELTRRRDMRLSACHRIIPRLQRGEPIELSTGLYTDNLPAPPGSHHNGRPYDYIAVNYRPDHLAVLPDQTGACSLTDGCGILVNRASNSPQPLPPGPRRPRPQCPT